MPKITQFDRTSIPALREAILKALEPVAAEFGLSLAIVKGSTFHDTFYRPVIEFAVKGEGGVVLTREAEVFRVNAYQFPGLQATDLGQSFINKGQTYTITGMTPRSNRRPIQTKGPDGKTYFFAADDVVRLLAATRAIGGAS